MGRKSKAQAKKRQVGPLQAFIDRQANEEAKEPVVSQFAKQHGDYAENARWGSRSKVTINRGGTAVDRWTRSGTISDSQLAAINHCQHLWAKLGSHSVVVDFNRVRGQPHGDGYAQHEALAELHRIQSGFPRNYWDCFERVCRFDEPTGVAGSRLANGRRSAETAARLIVCFIADLIAMRERLSY